MPTLPMKASKSPAPDAGPEEITAVAWEMLVNSCGFNVTGHPATSLPCGLEDDRSIGVMLAAWHWQESTILRSRNKGISRSQNFTTSL